MMLQEELRVPLASEMALLGCYKYAVTGEPNPWEPQEPKREQEPEDDVKVVRYSFLISVLPPVS